MKLTIIIALTILIVISPALPSIHETFAQKQPDVDEKQRRMTDSDKNKIFDELDEEIKGKSNNYRTSVIVLLDTQITKVPSKIKELKGFVGEFDITSSFSLVNGFAGKLTKQQILKMTKHTSVIQIEPDLEVKALLDTSTQWFGVKKARSDFGVDGSVDGNSATYSSDDIVIAVIDTGIDMKHKDLDGGKVIGWRDFVNGSTTPYDDNGHGTWVASIAAGDGGGNSAYVGVAPGAALVGVKVLDKGGSGTISRVISGVDWVVSNKITYGIEIVNMSLGSRDCSDGTDSLSVAVNNAVNNGLTVVVAAGNSGPRSCSIGTPGAAEKAITVGAVADVGENGFSLASFSSRGPTLDGRIKPDIVAPGVRLTGAKSGSDIGYATFSGTSGATPFVSGVAALMLHANTALSPPDIKSGIVSNGADWGPSNKDIDYGSGRLDAYETVRKSVSPPLTGSNIAVPNHTFISDALPGTGSFDNWEINVLDSTYPIAITMIMPTWSSSTNPDFDMRLYNPSGTQIASSLGVSRQETIGVSVTSTGVYTLRVESYTGSGTYFLDISSGSNPPGPTVPSAPQNLLATADDAQVTLSWSAPSSDGGSAVTNYNVYRSSSSGTLASKTVIATLANVLAYTDTTVTNGTPYFYQVTAVNSVGESAGSNEASAAPTEPDNSAPSITAVTRDTAGTTGEAKTVYATITDNVGVSGATVHYTPIDGTETSTAMNRGDNDLWSATVPIASDKVGSITYYITTTDAAANIARDPAAGTYFITVTDNDAPAVAVTSPANGAIVRGAIIISADANDNIGVMSVEFFDGENSIGIDATAPYNVSWSTVATSDGAHSIRIQASDADGNSASSTINVTVDNTPPTKPTNLVASVLSQNQIELEWSPSIDSVGVAQYNVYRDGFKIGTVGFTSYSDTSLSASTSYIYEISAVDSAGNESLKSDPTTATTLAPPPAGITVTTHSETVKRYNPSSKTLNLLSQTTGTVTGQPTNTEYKYTFPTGWTLDRITKAQLTINGLGFDIIRMASNAGNVITVNLAGFTFNNGDTVQVTLETKFSKVPSNSYSLRVEFTPGTWDERVITL